jgi:hypothetical protein
MTDLLHEPVDTVRTLPRDMEVDDDADHRFDRRCVGLVGEPAEGRTPTRAQNR